MDEQRYSDEVVEKALHAYWGATDYDPVRYPLNQASAARLDRLKLGIRAALRTWDTTRDLSQAAKAFWEESASAGRTQTPWDDLSSARKASLMAGIQHAREVALASPIASELAEDQPDLSLAWDVDWEHVSAEVESQGELVDPHPEPEESSPEEGRPEEEYNEPTTLMSAPPRHTVDVHFESADGVELSFIVRIPMDQDPLTLPNAVGVALDGLLRTTVVTPRRAEVVQ